MQVVSVLDGADSLFDVNFASQRAELIDQIFTNLYGLLAADRMRLLRDGFEMSHRSRRGKDIQ
jgi:hypothetical protein